MYSLFFKLIFIFLPVLFIHKKALSQHTLQWGIYTGAGINIPPVRPIANYNNQKYRLRSGRNFSWGFDLLYSRKSWGLKSELGLAHRTFYDPNSLSAYARSYLSNYIGNSSSLDLSNANIRFLGFFRANDPEKEIIRYFGGLLFSRHLWIELREQIKFEKSISVGIEFNISEVKYGSFEFGLFYDYSLDKKTNLVVQSYYGAWLFEYKRNSVFRVQLNYHPSFKHLKISKPKQKIKSPRYSF